MIIDTHCHYNLAPLLDNVSKYWQEAQSVGVEKTIVVGTNLKNSQKAIELSHQYQEIYSSIGLHPNNYTKLIKDLFKDKQLSNNQELLQLKINATVNSNLNSLKKLLTETSKDNKVVAIGEVGLDFYQLKLKGLKRELIAQTQIEVFAQQLKLAWTNNLVAIIHVRDQQDRYSNHNNAYFTTLKVIKQIKETISPSLSSNFILHCISGPTEYIKQAIELRAYFGVGGNVTYNSADELRATILRIPQNRLLLETDAPYLAPKKITEVCEPKMIKITADFLQDTLKIDLDIIHKNTKQLFLWQT